MIQIRVGAVVSQEIKDAVREIGLRDRRSEGDIVRLALEAYIEQWHRRVEALQDHDRREVAI